MISISHLAGTGVSHGATVISENYFHPCLKVKRSLLLLHQAGDYACLLSLFQVMDTGVCSREATLWKRRRSRDTLLFLPSSSSSSSYCPPTVQFVFCVYSQWRHPMMEEVSIGPSRPSSPRKRPSTVSLSFLPEHNGGIPMYASKRRLFIY